MTTILAVCTGNICRSPMAAALLRERLGARDTGYLVESAGLLEAGRPASDLAIAIMAERGLDLSGHRSRRLAVDDVQNADLVLGMAREHVREAVLLDPTAFGRAFTLKELTRRGQLAGPRHSGESLASWLERVDAGRAPTDLLGGSDDDDVHDPIGSTRATYEAVADELDHHIALLIELALPEPT